MSNDLITKLTARRDAAQKDLNKLEAQKAGFEIAINKAQSALSMANDMLDIVKAQGEPATKPDEPCIIDGEEKARRIP